MARNSIRNKKEHVLTPATSLDYVKKKLLGVPRTTCALTLLRCATSSGSSGGQFEVVLVRGRFTDPGQRHLHSADKPSPHQHPATDAVVCQPEILSCAAPASDGQARAKGGDDAAGTVQGGNGGEGICTRAQK